MRVLDRISAVCKWILSTSSAYPSCKNQHRYGTNHHVYWENTQEMAMFNSYVTVTTTGGCWVFPPYVFEASPWDDPRHGQMAMEIVDISMIFPLRMAIYHSIIVMLNHRRVESTINGHVCREKRFWVIVERLHCFLNDHNFLPAFHG